MAACHEALATEQRNTTFKVLISLSPEHAFWAVGASFLTTLPYLTVSRPACSWDVLAGGGFPIPMNLASSAGEHTR